MTPSLTYQNGTTYERADAHLAESDPVMADPVQRLGPIHPPDVHAPPTVFGSLIMAIVRQQLATAAAVDPRSVSHLPRNARCVLWRSTSPAANSIWSGWRR